MIFFIFLFKLNYKSNNLKQGIYKNNYQIKSISQKMVMILKIKFKRVFKNMEVNNGQIMSPKINNYHKFSKFYKPLIYIVIVKKKVMKIQFNPIIVTK